MRHGSVNGAGLTFIWGEEQGRHENELVLDWRRSRDHVDAASEANGVVSPGGEAFLSVTRPVLQARVRARS